MDLKTTSDSTYKDFKVGPPKREKKDYDDDKKPIIGFSSY